MSKYRFDTSIFDRYVHDMKHISKYQPVVMLANYKGKAFLYSAALRQTTLVGTSSEIYSMQHFYLVRI